MMNEQNPKIQTPNPKEAPNFKFQTALSFAAVPIGFGIWSLGFEVFLP